MVIRGTPKRGPPPERILALSNIVAPRLARRPGQQQQQESKDEVGETGEGRGGEGRGGEGRRGEGRGGRGGERGEGRGGEGRGGALCSVYIALLFLTSILGRGERGGNGRG